MSPRPNNLILQSDFSLPIHILFSSHSINTNLQIRLAFTVALEITKVEVAHIRDFRILQTSPMVEIKGSTQRQRLLGKPNWIWRTKRSSRLIPTKFPLPRFLDFLHGVGYWKQDCYGNLECEYFGEPHIAPYCLKKQQEYGNGNNTGFQHGVQSASIHEISEETQGANGDSWNQDSHGGYDNRNKCWGSSTWDSDTNAVL